MKSYRQAVLFGALFIFTGAASRAATRVPLTLMETAGVDRRGEPVTRGIPLPRGELEDIRRVRLLRGNEEVPAQFRAAGLWRPGRGVRWLLVDLVADIRAGEQQAYTLEYGPDVAASARCPHPLRIEESRGEYRIDTGTATFLLSRSKFSLFDEVRIAGGAVIPLRGRESRCGASVRGLMPLVTRAIPSPENRGRSHLIYMGTSEENGILYTITPRPDGSVAGRGTCSHYNIMAADAFAVAYRLTGEQKYLDTARKCFAYGVRNACWKDGPPIYTQVHSAGGALHGNVFMAVDSALRRESGKN